VVEDSFRPEQLASELRQPLVLLRPAQLDRGALRTGDARALVRAERAIVRVAQRLQLDPLGGDALADGAVAVDAIARGLEQAADADVERGGEGEPERAPLVQQRRHRDLPAAAFVAEPV